MPGPVFPYFWLEFLDVFCYQLIVLVNTKTNDMEGVSWDRTLLRRQMERPSTTQTRPAAEIQDRVVLLVLYSQAWGQIVNGTPSYQKNVFPLDELCILLVRVRVILSPRPWWLVFFFFKGNISQNLVNIVGVLECFLPVFCILEEFKLEKPVGYFQLVDNPDLAAWVALKSSRVFLPSSLLSGWARADAAAQKERAFGFPWKPNPNPELLPALVVWLAPALDAAL